MSSLNQWQDKFGTPNNIRGGIVRGRNCSGHATPIHGLQFKRLFSYIQMGYYSNPGYPQIPLSSWVSPKSLPQILGVPNYRKSWVSQTTVPNYRFIVRLQQLRDLYSVFKSAELHWM